MVNYLYSNYLPYKKTGQTRQVKPGKASKGKATYRSINTRRFKYWQFKQTEVDIKTNKQTMRQSKRQ
jgi:hypothetical protein